MQEFAPESSAYRASVVPELDNAVVHYELIQPPVRNQGVQELVHSRAQSVLLAIKTGNTLPPIEVEHLPDLPHGYQYRVIDGYHRFYLSLGLGFTHLPVVIKPIFNWESLKG